MSWVRASLGVSFNPCVGRNSSGAAPIGTASRATGRVSIRVLVGIAQELGWLVEYLQTIRVSIRVLVGIAQELRGGLSYLWGAMGFNPCVGRNSSGASCRSRCTATAPWFQSVCWSE